MSRKRFDIYYLKSLNVIKEMVSLQCATINYHLRGLLKKLQSRVSLDYHLVIAPMETSLRAEWATLYR